MKKENNMPKNILIADDSDSVRNILKLTLCLKGHKVTEAVNGKEAFEKVSAGQYDLLISDIDMPFLTGLELLDKIRNELKNTTLPIIICTAEKIKDESVILTKGARIMHKPFSPNELLEIVGM